MTRQETNSAGERGAVIVEASLIVGLFIILVLTFLDFGRYFAARALLSKAAVDAANNAARVADFDLDLFELSSTDTDYAQRMSRFHTARQTVYNTALSIATTALVGTSGSDATIKLRAMQVRDSVPGDNTNPLQTSSGELAVLRPGDSFRAADGSWIHHPSRCMNGAPGCTNPRMAFEPMDQLLRDYPLVVDVRGEMETISPWLGDRLPLHVTVLSWREQAAKSTFRQGAATPGSTNTVAPPPSGTGTDYVDNNCNGHGTVSNSLCSSLNLCPTSNHCACAPCGGN